MSRRETYEKKAEELLTPIIEEHSFELVDLEYVKEGSDWYLRAYIDKPGGVNIDDCEVVSRAFSDLLDEKDFIEDAYILEVSSPGLGRPLKKNRDFERNLGKTIECKSYKPIDGEKEFTGVLRAYTDDAFTLETQDGGTKDYQRKEMALIREYVEW